MGKMLCLCGNSFEYNEKNEIHAKRCLENDFLNDLNDWKTSVSVGITIIENAEIKTERKVSSHKILVLENTWIEKILQINKKNNFLKLKEVIELKYQFQLKENEYLLLNDKKDESWKLNEIHLLKIELNYINEFSEYVKNMIFYSLK